MAIIPEALIKRSRPQYNVNHLLLMYVGAGKSKDIDAIDFTLGKYSKMSPYNTKRTEVIEEGGKASKDSLNSYLPTKQPVKGMPSRTVDYKLQKDYENKVVEDIVYHQPKHIGRLASVALPYTTDKKFISYSPIGSSETRIDHYMMETPLLKRTETKKI